MAPGGKVGGNMLTHGSCGRTERIRVRSACRLHVRDLFAKGENGVAVATAPIHGLSFLNVCRAQRSITLDTQATRGDARCPLPSELNPRVTGLPSEPRRVRPAPRRAARGAGHMPNRTSVRAPRSATMPHARSTPIQSPIPTSPCLSEPTVRMPLATVWLRARDTVDSTLQADPMPLHCVCLPVALMDYEANLCDDERRQDCLSGSWTLFQKEVRCLLLHRLGSVPTLSKG